MAKVQVAGASPGPVYMVDADDNKREIEANQLPPMAHVMEPEMKQMSTRIRWWAMLGYSVKEISAFLGCRYQMVRNVIVTIPKRAIREDLPPLEIRLFELDDDLEAMDKAAMQQQMAAQRAEHRAERRALNKARRELDQEVDEGEDD